jgi:KaiC/GvpD/RAD55 family RecA-like ATPase
MATCPNKNLNEWKSLVTARGENVAFYLWDKYDGNVPLSEYKSETLDLTETIQELEDFKLYEDTDKLCGEGICNYTSFKSTKKLEQVGLNPYPNESGSTLHVSVKTPIADFLITHYVAAVAINDGIYIYDMPQHEFISDTFYGKQGVNLKTEFKPRLIPLTVEDISANYLLSEKQAIQFIKSIIEKQESNIAPSFKNYIKSTVKNADSYIQELEDLYKNLPDEYESHDSKVAKLNDKFYNEPLTKADKLRISKLLTNKFKIRTRQYVPRKAKEPFMLSDFLQKTIGVSGFNFQYDSSEGLDKVLQKLRSYLRSEDFVNTMVSEYDYAQNKSLDKKIERVFSMRRLMDSFIRQVQSVGWDQALKNFDKQQRYDIQILLSESIKDKSDNQKVAILRRNFSNIDKFIDSFGLKIKPGESKLNALFRENFKAKSKALKIKNTLDLMKSSDDADFLFGLISPEIVRQYSYFQSQGQNFFQLEEATSTAASPEVLQKVKEILKKMGVNIESLTEYAKTSSVNVSGVNALADLVRGVIAVAEGKEDVALTEEMVHVATAIIEQKNPILVTEMISKIDRFKIYTQTLEQYKNNKAYQLPNGKPDIRKIKKEAVDRLISELIINQGEDAAQFPELLQEENRSIVRRWWNAITDFFRGMYKSANISIFEETAKQIIEGGVEGQVSDIVDGDVFFQLAEPTKAQKEVQRRILETEQALRKGAIDPETDVLTLGDSDATNFYEYKQPDGTYKRVLKRVTDRVKRYYKDRFGDKAFSKEEKAFNEFKRTLGVKYHGYFEEIHDRFFNKDGTRKSNPEPRPDIRDQVDAEVYSKLENYYTALIESRSKGGKNILVFSEVRVYDPREQEAGTIDLLIVDEDGTGNIFDWKFMSVAEGQKDVQWYKQEAYNIQLKRYRDMLLANYGVKKIGMNRAVPILFQIKPLDKRVEGSKPTLTGINVGSVDTTKIEDLRLVPISEKTESTGFESLDKFIKQLNSVLDKISSRNASSDEQREFKRERLTIVREAIRAAQGTMNIKPVIDVMLVMMKEGENLINDYNVIYKNANAQSNEFTNKQLSDFSSELRDFVAISEVFGRIGENIGKLIYSKDMDTTNMSEEEISGRKELLKDVEEKAKEIIQSRQQVFDIAGKFADKYMGLRNLVSGLLNPEAVVKGLGSFFRTVSEIPLASVQILYKLTENAKSRASADAKVEVDELMKIREKLAARGGDLRALVKKIYRKDDKGNFVNKLIYKYSTEFGDGVRDNALEENRSKQWLKENIDVAAYYKEANALLEKRIDQINKDYANNEELRDRLILQEKQKWDITRADFNGWSNYVILRHPLPKWLSEEYKELQKDQDLLDLYNFITDINDKAADAGYLTNQGVSTFLPWVRKSMAESLAWDFSLSTIMNFGNKLSLRADDVGRGKIDSLTNEIENGIPKYYTTDFTRLPGGEVDTSEVSEDLFANMVLYIGHMNNYKYLFEVEGQIELIKTIETFKEHLETANNGNVVIRNGVVNPQSGNEENTKIYDQFMRAVLYDQKYALDDTDVTLSTGPAQYVKKTVNKVAKHFGGKEVFEVSDEPGSISLVKSMETMNRYFQLKALGLEFVSGAVNWFGTNVQLAAQSGNYFTRGEVLGKQYKILGNKLNKTEQDLLVSLVDTFMPLREDPNYENFKKAGMSELTKRDFGDFLMFFMRTPEQFTEKAVFMTLLDNIMVLDGRFENIRNVVRIKYADQRKGASAFELREIDKQIENDVNQLKKEKSIGSTVKMEDGKLVIPGFDLSNRDEIQRLTKLTREISTNATGGINSANTNRAQMNIWFKSAMVFKSWIPGLAFTRFDHLRKISDDFSVRINEDGTTEGERYDIGRLRLFAYVLGTTITQQSNNILNIINLNDKGLIELDRMFEKFAEEYFQRTGQTLNMTREEFIDLIRTNLRNQLSEFTLTLSLMGLALSMGMLAPDDDEDRATKNLFRYSQRVVDKFVSELTFFINPVEFQGILEGNLIPAIGVVTDATRFVSHFTEQVTGFDVSDPTKSFEDVQKDAQPIKNLAKMFPVSKSLVNYLAMFDEEFAKEYDITIPKTAPK